MNWINGYLKTTLFFWKDEKVTFEQLAILPAVFTSGFYIIFLSISGQSSPRISIRPYIFPVLLAFIISYYLIGRKGFLLSQDFLKFLRVLILHSIITLFSFVSLLSFHISLSNLKTLGVSSIVTSLILAYHTYKTHPFAENNPFKTRAIYFLGIILMMYLCSVITGFFLYHCALPNQG